MQVEQSLLIKNRSAIIHIIAISTSLSDSAAIEKEWDMIQKAVNFIPGKANYNEMCKIQKDLRKKNISLFGDYILELIPTTLM